MTATSYITVACPRTDRYFDLDAVRTSSGTAGDPVGRGWTGGRQRQTDGSVIDVNPSHGWGARETGTTNPAGAPPLDWVHDVDLCIDAVLHPPREIYEGPPMTATLLVGDVHERQTELPDHSFDLIITSPPFLALRSYLPDDHPDKHLEIGSERTPADYLDVLLALTAEWRRLLAPHGSIAVELGDTYAGSGGAGGDYNPDGLREGQPRFRQNSIYGRISASNPGGAHERAHLVAQGLLSDRDKRGNGWPLDKSLCGIPQSYMLGLIHGRNPINGNLSPAGQWRIRNLKPWIRTNPPVGALGDKERPATSYITVATLARDRWFDLDAVRTAVSNPDQRLPAKTPDRGMKYVGDRIPLGAYDASTSAGAPPLDWWHQTDAIIDHELQQRAGNEKRSATRAGTKFDHDGGRRSTLGDYEGQNPGARGHHVRKALERAGILPPHPDALDVSPKGYSGAHYAVWPPELVRQLVDEMCPRRVCTVCGEPSRRIVGEASYVRRDGSVLTENEQWNSGIAEGKGAHTHKPGGATKTRQAPTLGWSDCGCPPRNFAAGVKDYGDHWRPGRILDPFSGSGTTLAVATGMGRDAVGIDLDPRNAHLTEARCGMFLTVDWGDYEPTDELPSVEIVAAVKEDLL